ncbi:MAG: TetR/AcrR family transcriptional regulator [Microbacterium sp.]|uniref:TetR/AcrR family transcriptional regulator n=1 Tax=Microbacterium sp. TaxID=51671 RepID=UPI003F9D15B2
MSDGSPRDYLLQRATSHLAQHGIGDASLRTIATALGTSHRMLIYHFGSRDGLLAAVVERLQRDQQAILDQLVLRTEGELSDAAWRFWTAMVDADAVGPLLFELSAPAMRGAAWADTFRASSATWTSHLAALQIESGQPAESAESTAKMTMALVRGALWELGITGDRSAADATVRAFLERYWSARPE